MDSLPACFLCVFVKMRPVSEHVLSYHPSNSGKAHVLATKTEATCYFFFCYVWFIYLFIFYFLPLVILKQPSTLFKKINGQLPLTRDLRERQLKR